MRLPLSVRSFFCAAFLVPGLFLVCAAQAVKPDEKSALTRPDSPLQRYLAARVEAVEKESARDIENPAQWQERAPVLRQQLMGMLGLDPLPERGDLHPVVTGRLEHEEFTVEKLHFQSLPGLYVTANLYLPKKRSGRLPAILYVCGHSVMREGGVSLGNKTGYQHHPAWFARNGFVALAIDTIQLGEIPGVHHGTNRLNQWWWNSRGYTPAGVETWNGMRALDYLVSREEVDASRLGITGRSGGGAYSWYIAAVDERIKAAVPVAGITDLRNHVIDGVIDGHCDCMFLLNTRRWDFSKLAALIAPRPLLIANTDKDPIFPLDGVERIHRDVASVYKSLGAKDKLGLLITEGPHKDTQELQAPAFRWFKRFLAGTPDYPAPLAEKLFSPVALRVFEGLPRDERTSTAHEWFVPRSKEKDRLSGQTLREVVFPRLSNLKASWSVLAHEQSAGQSKVLFSAATEPADVPGAQPMVLVSGTPEATNALAKLLEEGRLRGGPLSVRMRIADGNSERAVVDSTAKPSGDTSAVDCVLLPRGLEVSGPQSFHQNAWSISEKDSIRIRRRFMLLGETLDSIHVRDLVCILDAFGKITSGPIEISASGAQGANAAVAAVLTKSPVALRLRELPVSFSEKGAPDHFNILRVTDMDGILDAARARGPVRLE